MHAEANCKAAYVEIVVCISICTNLFSTSRKFIKRSYDKFTTCAEKICCCELYSIILMNVIIMKQIHYANSVCKHLKYNLQF